MPSVEQMLRWLDFLQRWFRGSVRVTRTILYFEDDSSEHVHWDPALGVDWEARYPDATRMEVRVRFPSGTKRRYVVYPGHTLTKFALPPCGIVRATLRGPQGELDVTKRIRKYLPARIERVEHMFRYYDLDEFDSLVVTDIVGKQTVIFLSAHHK